MAVTFNEAQAGAMLDRLAAFADARNLDFTPDLNRLLTSPMLWQEPMERNNFV